MAAVFSLVSISMLALEGMLMRYNIFSICFIRRNMHLRTWHRLIPEEDTCETTLKPHI